jgi:hypothetical protein
LTQRISSKDICAKKFAQRNLRKEICTKKFAQRNWAKILHEEICSQQLERFLSFWE